MSEHNLQPYNYLGLIFKTEREQHPEWFKPIDVKQVEQFQNELRAAREKTNPSKPVPAQVEYNRLNNQLFNLKQYAHATEVKVNNEAGNVRLYEDQLSTLLKGKKAYEAVGNLLAARNHEHQIQRVEADLANARDRLSTDMRYNSATARELRTWQTENEPRLAELKKELETPKVIGKEADNGR